MSKIAPCLWFDGRAEEAARFYAEVLPDSRVDAVHRSPVDYPAGKAGDALTVQFTLVGMPVVGLNGGGGVPFTDAISFQIYTEDQAETNRLWSALLADGGKEVQCSWLKDKFGLSWQIAPRRLLEMISDTANPAGAARAMLAMMGMVKIDIAALEQAYAGDRSGEGG